MTEFVHVPVMLSEVIELLRPVNGGNYFDGTLGGGGYAEAILIASSPGGRLFGVDIDTAAIEASRERLKKFEGRTVIENLSYADIGLSQSAQGFDGMVLDLGVSSHQFDEGARGFSFQSLAPLDMRMDVKNGLTAFDVVNGYEKDELVRVFRELGEERFAERIAERIVRERVKKPIETTRELENICFHAVPPYARHMRIHPATRVFQALRIEVNGELKNLEMFLERFPSVLNRGGRVVIVSYHSLEDRLVKRRFAGLNKEGSFTILTKKPLTPTQSETERNPRSRSAKLRAIEKI